jgi:hypothetical protein
MFFNIGKRWPKLMQSWNNVERTLPATNAGNYLSHQLNLRLLFVTSSSISKSTLKWAEENFLIENISSWLHDANVSNFLSGVAVWIRGPDENLLLQYISFTIQPHTV